jgi:hypothetical protein
MSTPTTTAAPAWLSDNVPDLSPKSKEVIDIYPTTSTTLEMRDAQLERMFHHVIHKLSTLPFTEAVKSGPYEIEPVTLMKWIRRDPKRMKELEETQEAIAEVESFNLIHIADADTLEDSATRKLRIDSRKDTLGYFNRRKFGKDNSPNVAPNTGPITINISSLVPTPITIDQTDATPTASQIE